MAWTFTNWLIKKNLGDNNRKKSRKKKLHKSKTRITSPKEKVKTPSPVISDVYADLMDVFYQETNGANFQQTIRFDSRNNSFVLGTTYQGNVYYCIEP